jgi:hypothetical protein
MASTAEPCSLRAGQGPLAGDMTEVSLDLYAGLQAFFRAHPRLQRRPFFAAGESFAGKFVPCLGARPDRLALLMRGQVCALFRRRTPFLATCFPSTCSSVHQLVSTLELDCRVQRRCSMLCEPVTCLIRELLRIAAPATGSKRKRSTTRGSSNACGVLTAAACTTGVSGDARASARACDPAHAGLRRARCAAEGGPARARRRAGAAPRPGGGPPPGGRRRRAAAARRGGCTGRAALPPGRPGDRQRAH